MNSILNPPSLFRSTFCVCALLCLGPERLALANWPPEYRYSITRIGLYGPEFETSSALNLVTTTQFITGTTSRQSDYGGGLAAWVWNPSTRLSSRVGLLGEEYTSITGGQSSGTVAINRNGQTAGNSIRALNSQLLNGRDSWVWSPETNTTELIGLTSADHTTGNRYRQNVVSSQNETGFILGYARRFTQSGTDRGLDFWLWNPTTRATIQLGLSGSQYTASNNFRSTNAFAMSDDGQTCGTSGRYNGLAGLGQDAWVWLPTTQTTTQIGLIGTGFQSQTGMRRSGVLTQTRLGQIVGESTRYRGTTENGLAAWVWSSSLGATIELGLSDPIHTIASSGFRRTTLVDQSESGQVIGYTGRPLSNTSFRGSDAWVWNPTLGHSVQIGLTGGAFTASTTNGSQTSIPRRQTLSGFVVGESTRYNSAGLENGVGSWIWNPTTQSTAQTGLITASHTGSDGFQKSITDSILENGRAIGYSQRVVGLNTENGQDTWTWDPTTNTTQQTGLNSPEHTGSSGYRFSRNIKQNLNGLVTGSSGRFIGVSTTNGTDTWAFTPETQTVHSLGLDGPSFRGSNGYRFSEIFAQTEGDQVAGASSMYTDVNTWIGAATWVWDADSLTTRRTGLVTAAHTNQWGGQSSSNFLQTQTGVVVGHSVLYTPNSIGQSGQDVWYYDPVSRQTRFPLLGIPSITSAENSRYSKAYFVTDTGFLIGSYIQYRESFGFEHAFIYRPDLGFADLGSLINGQFSQSVWDQLNQPIYAEALEFLIVKSNRASAREIFVLNAVPSPHIASILGLSALLGCSSRRRARRSNPN